MDFRLTPEQTGFAQSLTELMTKADSVAAARAWASGDHEPGQALWKRLADQGVTALVLPEDDGGLGGTPVDLVVAFEVLGHQLAVGPVDRVRRPRAAGRGRDGHRRRSSPLSPYAARRRRGPAAARRPSSEQRAVGRHDPAAVRGATTPSRSTTDATRPGRAGLLRRAARLRRAAAGRLGGVRAAAQAVRPHHRLLPGDQAPAGRRTDRAGLRASAGARSGAVAAAARRVGARRWRPATRRTSPRGWRCRCTARSATPPSSTSASGSTGCARWSAHGATRRTTGAGSRTRWPRLD